MEEIKASELNFHIWNANWAMKCEAKMAAYGEQFCRSVLVPYEVLYVNSSLPNDFLHFPEGFLFENTHKISLQKIEISLGTSNIFWQNQTKWQVILFTKINY